MADLDDVESRLRDLLSQFRTFADQNVVSMAPGRCYKYESLDVTISQEGQVDDSTVLMPGAKFPSLLRDRFFRCLSSLIAADVTVRDASQNASVNVTVSRTGTSPQPTLDEDRHVHQFIRSLESDLRHIHTHGDGPLGKAAMDELWDAILLYVCKKRSDILHRLQQGFRDNQDTLDKLVADSFWMDEDHADFDITLTDKIILLRQDVTNSHSPEQVGRLIDIAASILQKIPSLAVRLQDLLKNAEFSDGLYRSVIALASPKHAFDTFVRTAKTDASLSSIKIHLPPLKPSKILCISRPRQDMRDANPSVKSPTRPTDPGVTTASTSSLPFSPSANSRSGKTSPASPALESSAVSFTTGVRHATQSPTPQQKSSQLTLPARVAHEAVSQLISSIANGHEPDMYTDAYYLFGFVTTTNDEEAQQLGGLYGTILRESPSLQPTIEELVKALATNTLVELFDMKEWGHFRKTFPRLETFLSTPPSERPTVWRLKQFVTSKTAQEPIPCLQRDFGFKLCRQREEVQQVKEFYASVLKGVNIMDLHYACAYGRLPEFTKMKGFNVDQRDQRFLVNDYPAPGVGYDNDLCVAQYGPLFKKPAKG